MIEPTGNTEPMNHPSGKKTVHDANEIEFLSLMMHQILTPVTTMHWYLELLLSGKPGKLNRNQKEHLREMDSGNKRLVKLINALLNVSRIEKGVLKVEPRPTNLKVIADTVLKEIAPHAKKQNIKIVKKYDSKLPLIKVDPKLMRIIIQAVINNAVNYSDPKNSVNVTITKRRKDILITIKDTGWGIPKGQQKQIFTRLFRADNVRKKGINGNGLELFIAKSILDQTGGTIDFESGENKGSTFYLTIPLKGTRKRKGEKELTHL